MVINREAGDGNYPQISHTYGGSFRVIDEKQPKNKPIIIIRRSPDNLLLQAVCRLGKASIDRFRSQRSTSAATYFEKRLTVPTAIGLTSQRSPSSVHSIDDRNREL